MAGSAPPGPPEAPSDMEAEAELLESFSAIPTISRAWITPPGHITVQTSQRNIAANKQRKLNRTWQWQEAPEDAPVPSSGCSFPPSDAQLHSQSPSGRRTVMMLKCDEGVTVQIWSPVGLIREVIVGPKLHGSVFNDGWFGKDVSWNADETQVLYVAEAPPATQTPEWGAAGYDKEASPHVAPKQWRGVGPHTEDWGELTAGMAMPRPFLLDVEEGRVTAVGGFSDDVSVGQPVFTPPGGDPGVVVTVWPHRPLAHTSRRLGIVYCFNRPCHLAFVSLRSLASDAPPPEPICLTPDRPHAYSPRFSPGPCPSLVFLSHDEACRTGVHCGTSMLCCQAWPPPSGCAPDTVVLVSDDQARPPGSFPGLYCGLGGASLLDGPFLDAHTLVMNTQWGSEGVIVAIDIKTGNVTRLTPQGKGSWEVLAIHEKRRLVAAKSSLTEPLQVVIATCSETAPLSWKPIAPPGELAACLPAASAALAAMSKLCWDVISLTDDAGLPFEAVVCRPASSDHDACPAVLFPHGGPHAAFSTAFMTSPAYLASLGYTVILCNFRGSTGYGSAALQSLPGAIGTNDTADCIGLLDASIARGWVDPDRVAVVGGSHGGFLAGHLMGQHPDRFKCAVLLNPVLNLSLMVHVSDIPDWVYVETYGEGMGRFNDVPTADDHQAFLDKSPIRYVDQVRGPCLFMLGAKDLRVPCTDAMRYVNALRSRNDAPHSEVFLFSEDSHPLDRPKTEFERWVNTVSWLKRYI